MKSFFATVLMTLLLFGIWKSSYMYGCVMMIFPIFILILIGWSFAEMKIHERACFKNCYFNEKSFFAKMLSARMFTVIITLLVSIMMTFSALYAIIDFPIVLWIYLIFHIALTLFIYEYLNRMFGNTFKDEYREIFAREWAINITAIPFVLAFVLVAYNGDMPSYLQADLSETIRAASKEIFSECPAIQYSMKTQRELDATFWWLMNEGSNLSDNKNFRIGAWLGFLLMNSFAILGINRMIAQVVYLSDKLLNQK